MPTGTFKILADGQLPAAKGTLYTVPAATTTLVKTIVLVATNVNRVVNIYVKKAAGTSRRILMKDYPLDIAAELSIERNLTLGVGDVIEGDAAAATEIDYIIFGIEYT